MRGRLMVAAALAAATVGLATPPARATTVPGRLYITSLKITDSTITAHIRHGTWAATIHYPRGAEVRYQVVNQGTRTYSLNILGSVTGKLRPGNHTSILVYWGTRGSFVFRASPRGAARLKVIVR